MRLTTLLLLLITLMLLTAPAASFAQIVSPSKSNAPFTGDSAAILRADGSNPSMSDDRRGLRNFDSGDSHVSCLTMRTYVVARENRDSDVTHTVRYYECVPAWKFDLRTSGQKNRDAGVPRP
jgi:hypothetical protein